MFFKAAFAFFCGVAFLTGTAAAQPAVVVSVAPVHSVVSAVMQGAGEPELLLNPAVSVHDYRLKPSDMRRLAKADVLFWGGEGLETFLRKPIVSAGLSGKNVALLSDSRLTLYPVRGEGGAEVDGHFWLAPENMAATARIVAEKLAAVDPDHASLYRENAARFEKRVRDLKTKGEKKLRPYAGRPYATLHDAYLYFEKSFGLPSLGAVFVDPHHAAGAGRIGELREKIKRAGKVCLFSEPQFSDKRVKVVAEDLSVVSGELDPAGVGLDPGADFYERLMNALFDSFVDCVSKLAE